MLHNDDDCTDDIPVLLDFGSMGVARTDVRNMAEARALQVTVIVIVVLVVLVVVSVSQSYWDI